MNSRLSVLSILFLLTLGCSKDNSQGGPTIGLKSYNTSVFNDGNGFNVVFTYSQKGGNPSYDTLTIIETRRNQDESDVSSPIIISGTRLPITPAVDKAEFSTNLQWQFIQYGIQGVNDTVDFQFVLVDLNQNHSDTVQNEYCYHLSILINLDLDPESC